MVTKRKRKILAIASGGGHWVQLRRLTPAFSGHTILYATVNPLYRTEVPGSKFYCISDVTRWDKAKCVIVALRILWILVKERPNIVMSTGALPGYIAIRLAKLLRAKTIWLDSIANVEELSLSGARIGKYADLWLTQWPHLAKDGGPEYAGQVL